jgi:hypothetical protein
MLVETKKYGNSVALSIFANLSTRQLVSFHDSTFNTKKFCTSYFTLIVWAFKRLERFHGQYNICEIYLSMMRATVFAYEYKLKTSLAHRSHRSLQSAYHLNAETFDRSMTIKTSLAFLRSLNFLQRSSDSLKNYFKTLFSTKIVKRIVFTLLERCDYVLNRVSCGSCLYYIVIRSSSRF